MHDAHEVHVAGRYRDGSTSDGWTDVRRCASGTFLSYLPRCACGWTGRERPATAAGEAACRREWFRAHVVVLPDRERAVART